MPNAGDIRCVSCGNSGQAERFRATKQVKEAVDAENDRKEYGHRWVLYPVARCRAAVLYTIRTGIAANRSNRRASDRMGHHS